ncbi:Potassium-transporting ATPase A chain [Thermodesulfobium narugense DSM 14796]|uniref:Potassium-transporting ATPase potassium-binding subunit n=1 Tax=Thermodesulfobium narugense DSM 14796 TaxID=747365 RepID=M1E4S0_9BACT|nr:potassium-transporting ATPase subunit KdpA [Thermodesulfobium narugense]AEE14467.1 Potassium-transporting ATPase A chain [Thermodesulfobium narugense DSM 14796]
MNLFLDLLQFALFIILLTLCVKPFGLYIAKVFQGEKIFISKIISPIEQFVYKLSFVNPENQMDWKEYAVSMLLFNMIGFIFLFLLLLTQQLLPLNPEHFQGFSLDLALNSAISFITNTNWQAYSGESSTSYLTQMLGFTVQNFLSAATGIAILIALIRGFASRQTKVIGNFWVDITRTTLYILLPLSIIFAVFLISQGVIQNFNNYQIVHFVSSQIIPMGPVASQEAIKLIGTNGGGFFNANSSHPYENPTPLTNFLEAFMIIIIPASLTYTFGTMIKNKKQGWAIYFVMLFLFAIFLSIQYSANTGKDPIISNLGVSGPYIEGQEVRFGVGGTTLFSTTTTAVACGAVNAMHDSLLPLGGMIPMILMLLGEVVFGGVGSGLYTMLAFVIIAVFVAGLMIGRTPEFLGKKIEVKEMWMSIIIVLTSGILVLIFTSIALVTKGGLSSILNPGPHGLSEILYAYASTANNNGSAFAGLNANTPFYNISTALAMLIGRYVPAVAAIYMASSLAEKKYTPPSIGTLPTDCVPFMIWLVLIIITVGALTFFSALALGPFLENLIMQRGF